MCFLKRARGVSCGWPAPIDKLVVGTLRATLTARDEKAPL